MIGALDSRSSLVAIGIDPGIAAVGYGLVRTLEGRLSLVTYGCIETESDETIVS